MDNDKTEERRARKAAYMKEYRDRKKGENINTRHQNSDTSSATTPSCNDIDTARKARMAEKQRRYRAKKKLESLEKFRGINSEVESTSTTTLSAFTSGTTALSVDMYEEEVMIDQERFMMVREFEKYPTFLRDANYGMYWGYAEERFQSTFGSLCFDDACSVCFILF
jgi:hypothetical protein